MWKYMAKFAEGEKKTVYSCDITKDAKYFRIENDSEPASLVCRKVLKNKGVLYRKGDLILKKKNVFIVRNMKPVTVNTNSDDNEIVLKRNDIVFSRDDDSEKVGIPFCEHGECTVYKAQLLKPDTTLTHFNYMNDFFQEH